jgi:hypothetical protein
MKILFASLLLILAFQISFGQENLEPVLIDTLDRVYPEDFGFRASDFKQILQNQPNIFIYAVIHPSKTELTQAWKAEGFLNGSVSFMSLDTNKFLILRGEPQEKFSVKFWRSSKSDEKVRFESNWNFTLPKNSKSFIVYNWGVDSTNSFLGYDRIFRDFLMANPKAIGQIQVAAKTIKDFKAERAKLISKLPNISEKQLRFVWNQEGSSSRGEWKIIPPKEKIRKL